jgi:hypothetical protein
MNTMKTQITSAVVALCLVPAASCAAPRNWKQMSNTTQTAIYWDAANISRTGKTIRYWILLDDTSGKQTKSIVMRNEVNCETMEWRRVFNAIYDDQMGKGNEKSSVPKDQQWKPAIPDDSVVLAFPICDAFHQLDQEAARASAKK